MAHTHPHPATIILLPPPPASCLYPCVSHTLASPPISSAAPARLTVAYPFTAVTLPTCCLAPCLSSILTHTHAHTHVRTLTPSLTIPRPPLSAVPPLMKHVGRRQNAYRRHFSSSVAVFVVPRDTYAGGRNIHNFWLRMASLMK